MPAACNSRSKHELGVRTSEHSETGPGRARAAGPSQFSDNAERLIGVGLVGDDRSCRPPGRRVTGHHQVCGCRTRRTRLVVDRRAGADGRFSRQDR